MKRSERVLVFTDTISDKERLSPDEFNRRERLRDISLLIAEVGRCIAKEIVFLEFPATGGHAKEPPEELWRLAFGEKTVEELKSLNLFKPLINKLLPAKSHDTAISVIQKNKKSAIPAVIALSNYSTSHTQFRNFLTGICMTRYASMPLFDAGMLEGAMSVDWEALSKRTNNIARIVNKAEFIKIATSNGTDISFSKKGRKTHADTGILTRPGSFGNLPAGEAYLAPLEGTANGKLVIEWAPTRKLSSPITLKVKDGNVTEILGDELFAESLKIMLNQVKENSNIAELGIGTNDMARRPDNILESEKIMGTIHIALGDNSGFGGNVKTPFHQDFVFFKPTATLIDKKGVKTVLMKNGNFAGGIL